MVISQRLYYNDSYTTQFTAQIVERADVEGRPAVVLDRTYFYPTGGGQPHDTGSLAGIPVVEVLIRDSDHAILHVLSGEPPEGEVACGTDWPRRFDHMQQHTGQHILTQAFVQTAGANTVSFHLSRDSVTIDLDAPALTPQVVDQVEDLANQIVIEDRTVAPRLLDPAEAERLGARIRRIPGHLATDGLRVIEVQDFDLTACGGTHVRRTGEIGLIKIVKLEKYKGGARVEFACGGRALRDYRAKNAAVVTLAADLTVGTWEVGEAVTRLRADLKTAQSELKRAQTALFELEVPALLASAVGRGGVHVALRVFDDRDPGQVRQLASRLIQTPGVIALLGAAGEKAQLFAARSVDLPHDMNVLLKTALTSLGSDRGGGRPDFAQGGGVAATLEQLDRALRAALDTL